MLEQMGQGVKVACEVRTEQFEGDLRAGLSDGVDALLIVVGPAVGKVVAVDYRDDGMAQVHRRHGLGKVGRLFRVKGRGALDGAHSAKSATPGAFLASDHEGRIAAGPAFVDVGATGLFANGVEHVVLHGGFRAVEHRLLSTAW